MYDIIMCCHCDAYTVDNSVEFSPISCVRVKQNNDERRFSKTPDI